MDPFLKKYSEIPQSASGDRKHWQIAISTFAGFKTLTTWEQTVGLTNSTDPSQVAIGPVYSSKGLDKGKGNGI